MTGTGKCGSVTIALMPYADTRNVGGEYKVWVRPLEGFGPTTQPNFGFPPSESKTGNFKIQVTD